MNRPDEGANIAPFCPFRPESLFIRWGWQDVGLWRRTYGDQPIEVKELIDLDNHIRMYGKAILLRKTPEGIWDWLSVWRKKDCQEHHCFSVAYVRNASYPHGTYLFQVRSSLDSQEFSLTPLKLGREYEPREIWVPEHVRALR